VAVSLDISFQDVPYSKDIEEAVIQQSNQLDHLSEVIARCRVCVIRGQKPLPERKTINVRIDVMTRHHSHVCGIGSDANAGVALRDAFAHVVRLLDGTALPGSEPAAALTRFG
jgi:hypothetical protein